MSINHNRQYFHNRCQNIAQINHKIQSVPDFIFPKIYSLARFQHVPSSADEKKAIFLKKQHSAPSTFATECQLPHARNSSIHATLDSQRSNCLNVSSSQLPRFSINSPRPSNTSQILYFSRLSILASLFPSVVLAGYTLFIPVRFYSLIRPHLARLLPHDCRITIYGNEKRGPV